MAAEKKRRNRPSSRKEREEEAQESAQRAAQEESEVDEDSPDEEDSSEEWVDLDDDEELTRRVLKALDGFVPGVLRRATESSVGQAILNEDRVKNLLSENKRVPKEVAGLVLSQVDGMRKEVLRVVSREIRVFLENVDLGGELAKILTSVSFEVKTEIRFVPNDQSVRAEKKRLSEASETEAEADAESTSDSEPRALKLRWGSKKRAKQAAEAKEDALSESEGLEEANEQS